MEVVTTELGCVLAFMMDFRAGTINILALMMSLLTSTYSC